MENCGKIKRCTYKITPITVTYRPSVPKMLFVVTAAGVVPCGGPKSSPVHRIFYVVQFIFFFWSFEIGKNYLRKQKIL